MSDFGRTTDPVVDQGDTYVLENRDNELRYAQGETIWPMSFKRSPQALSGRRSTSRTLRKALLIPPYYMYF